MMDGIEPQIRPLVDALNATGLVRTFSSCAGHYSADEQTIVDRNRADVRFVPVEGVTEKEIEGLLTYLLTRFKRQHGVLPVQVVGYKVYTPIDDEAVDETFVLELRPFNRFEPPDRKRADTDRAIEKLTHLVVAWAE